MARSLIDLKDLTYFIAAHEARSFSSAAARLNTVQSNVSVRIRLLEDRLSLTLFERRHRTLVPTGDGNKLYRVAVPLLGRFRVLEQTALRWTRRKRKRKARTKRASVTRR